MVGGGEGGRPKRVQAIFYWGSWPLKVPSKTFHLSIGGGLGWIKWLKNGAEKGLIIHAIFPALYPFWWKFYWLC